MLSFLALGLLGLVAAQNSTTTSGPSASKTAVTVAQDGSGDFTAINPAISFAQNSGVPTVTVMAATYSEAVVVPATATVTILGPTGSDYTSNQVTIVNSTSPLTINTSGLKGAVFRNINFLTTATGNAAVAVLRGTNLGFYGCSFVTPGALTITAGQGLSFFANSYFSGTNQIFYNYPTAYVYNSTIALSASGGEIVYSKGVLSGTTFYNSTVVFDSCNVVSASGTTQSNVYLAAPNNAGSQAIFRGCNLGSLVNTAGVHPSSSTFQDFYGEFANTGSGSYAANAAKRSAYDIALTAAQVSNFAIDQVYGLSFPGYGSYSTSWLDQTILSNIKAADAAQLASASSSSSFVASSTSTSSAASSTSSGSAASTTSPSSIASSTSTNSTSAVSTTSSVLTTSSVVSSSLTSSVAKTAVTVAPDGSGDYTAINAAISYAQVYSIPTVTVKAATYSEAVTVAGTATVTVVGQASSPTDYSQNQVVISNSSIPLTIGSNSILGATFKNINFVTTNSGTAPAVSVRGYNIAFYGCQIVSAGTTAFSSSLGITLIANSYVQGSDKLFYNYPTVYLWNSTISATASSSNLVYNKGYTVGSTFYNSSVVFDSCSLVPAAGSSATGVYLGAPAGAGAQAVYRNTTMSSYINSAGVHPSASSYVDYYGEFLTNGAGSYSSNTAARSSYDHQMTSIAGWSIDQVFGLSFPPYASTSLAWIDAGVLAAIQGTDAAQIAVANSTYSQTSSTSSAASSGTASSTSNGTATSTSAASTCSATAASGTYIVSQNSSDSCTFPNITAALNALPNDSQAKTIMISAGTYIEQLSITRNGKVTLVGATNYTNDYTQNTVTVEISNGQLTSAGLDETTPVINAKKTNDNSGLAAYNINFINTYPKTANTAALAGDFYGASIALYGCAFVGFQDTLLANKGTQVFSNSYIEGSIDFVWGYATAFFHQCMIVSNTPGACISAQSRSSATAVGGYVFDTCYVTYKASTYGSSFGLSYLGRPYSNFSIAVYTNSYIDKHINSAGWSVWQTNNPQTNGVTFGEYNNVGPGSWQVGTARASFATNLTSSQASAYTLESWIGDTSFIDMTAYNLVPSYNFTGPPTATSTSTGSIVTTTATINAHPDSGTVPPYGAVLVSPNGEVNGSYPNVTAALASLPSDNTNQTVFIYAGTYTEQVPSINRPGATRLIGYTTGNPGQAYADNTVTITFASGLSVSPLPSGASDAQTATVATASNRISWYNINLINTANSDGLIASYVTLAASIYGNDIGFYACLFDGWQDTLLTGATAGYQYYESCAINGAIDFIWGYSKAYFKGCTISGKKAKSCFTAQSRASASAIGGYIFDQCLITAAADATVDLTNTMYLGRPYSAYALVNYKNCYLDDVIAPAGWKIWSATDPRTDYVTLTEFNNTGPSAWQYNVAAREAFGNSSLLTTDEYPLGSVMDSTAWIDMTYWNSITTPLPAVVNTTTSTNITVSGNSTYDGTTPPAGALIVSQTSIAGVTTYPTIQDALNAAPTSSGTNATIFIYPGVYEEQLIVNKSGTIIFMGYSNATDDYSQNQVSIRASIGVDTQGDGSDVDSATVYATGNYFYAYNVNFQNYNGTQQDIASLGFAVKSSKYAALYNCEVYGNQDTLYISGYFFAFKTLITGNVDFIFGGGSGYFLNSTISPNEDGINLTADKRATNTTAAGMVFDQCSLVPANGATFTNVGLGRPWNDLARVAYVATYMSSMIKPAGWNVWSTSSPQTDAVLYGEYNNYGPGSSLCNRANFSQQLTDATVAQFQLANFFVSTSWIDFSKVDVSPFSVGIGSAPAACSSTTALSSIVSSTSTISATYTVTTTQLTTAKLTLTTDISTDVTSTSTVLITENDGTTITPAPVVKTTTVKATTTVGAITTLSGKDTTIKSTSTVQSTVTAAPATTTVKSTITAFATSTTSGKDATIKTTSTVQSVVTAAPVTLTSKSTTTAFVISTVSGKASTVKTTYTIQTSVTAAPSTTTVKSTTTIAAISTVIGKASTVTSVVDVTSTSLSIPKAITTTVNQGNTVTSTSTVTPKGATVTSSTTITGATPAPKTSTGKATTVTVLSTSYKTTTKKTTTTETCVPTSGVKLLRFKRDLVARGAGTATVTVVSTVTSFVKTSSIIVPESTYFATVTATTSISSVSTLKAATSTVSVTNLATATSTSTVSVAGNTVNSVATITAVSTISADTMTVTNVATTTSTSVVSVAGSTFTSAATTTQVSTIAGDTTTITNLASTTSTSTVSVAGSTIISAATITQTSTIAAGVATQTSLATVTSTSTVSIAGAVTTVVSTDTSIVKATAATPTVTSTKSTVSTVEITTTLAASTATVYKTATITPAASTVLVTPAAVTKTSTVKSTVTVFSTATTTAKNAPAC